MKKFIFLVFISCAGAVSAVAYSRITSSSGQNPKWPSMPVSYWINDRGSSQIANGSDFQAVQAAFQTWQNISSASISFTNRGTTSVRSVARDGMNLVTFSDDTTPLGSSILAATFSFYSTVSGQYTTLEADILVNPAFQWTTSGESGKYDIQSVVTHEIGHFLGLDHSGLVSSVMVPFGSAGQADQRTLLYDDIAGVSEIYPAAPGGVGQIRGSVASGGLPVFGAHVVAVDRDGTDAVSTLSQPDGSYLIRFLPPNDYRVYAEPLDFPVSLSNISGFYGSAKTDFGTTYSGNVSTLAQAESVQVASGGTANADIQVLPRSATGLNLASPAFALRLSRGASATARLGGTDITNGVVFSGSSPAITLGLPVFGGSSSSNSPTSASVFLSAAADAPLGPKNIAVNRGADTAVGSGLVVVVPPVPSNIAVSPSSGSAEAQTRVTITGNNFRSGARVYFGGLPATDVHVLSSTMLDALAPSGVPSTVNVQIFNSDGTNAVAPNAYVYYPSAPFISSVSPLSGSPMTSVVINGDHFDLQSKNVVVRFNDTTAPIVSVTTTQIQTIVPYGATSGPITVTVFGQNVTGPVFTIVPPAPSTNLAPNSYQFTDVSPGAGGANLSFSSPDDGAASVALPFNFSLFRDIFLAGTPVEVTTNGWLSLQSGSLVEFQNGPLPGTTVIRSTNETGTTPQALIAPFFDDLMMVSGSSISTRVLGSAPNRQFVVQWTNLTTLDEDGNDLKASLTFQAVLFEGSNDIQFVYKTMSGPHSDGSSATVGLQDVSRTTGIQSGYNQPIVSSGTVVTYRFQNSQYIQLGGDATPPTRPVVQDIGPRTNSTSELSASWTADDPESGIREYQYAIGTSPGASDVRAFTSTTNNSAVVSELSLQSGQTYYFAVRAVNNAGLNSEVGVSSGVMVDPAFQPYTAVIPYVPQDGGQFGGISLLASASMSVVLRAMDSNGTVITGSGIRNPRTLVLSAGQQTAQLVFEIFGIAAFDGWVKIDASAPGLSVYSATGSPGLDVLDGVAPRDPSTDFVAMHPGATLILVNPSTRAASVTITAFGTGAARALPPIPPRSRATTTLSAVSEIRSSEALAATERYDSPGRLGLASHQPVSAAQTDLTFAYGLTGAGYTTTVTLVNTSSSARDLTISFAAVSGTLRLEANSARSLSLGDFLGLQPSSMRTGAVRVTSIGGAGPALLGVADIENSVSRTTLEARPALTNASFVSVFQGNGWYTGLSIATGSTAAIITFDVYPPSGGVPNSATVAIGPNQQLSRQLSEFVPSVATQFGGYIRVRSDQPVWIWQIYGTTLTMASGPPQ